MRDQLGAFCAHAPLGGLDIGGGQGPLSGMTVGVKDLFDVEGVVTGAGNPDWFNGASPPSASASSVSKLIAAGGRVVGKTITDELAFSLNGENDHYGTPVNPAAPGRIPGGSSAGSASAVAGGLVDIGLGTDTGGSVRLPSSYCGIWGMRPTHGAIAIDGCVPLAPGFDTVGWFARDAATLAKAGAVLLGQGALPAEHGFTRVVIATDALERVGDEHRAALEAFARDIAGRVGDVETVTLADRGLDVWRDTFRVLQSHDVWRTHGDWVRRVKPTFGPAIAERFAYAESVTDEEMAEAQGAREAIRARLDALLTPETVLLVPGASGPPPLIGMAGEALHSLRSRALEVLCPAGLGGLPQLAMPAIKTDEGPIGLGLIGPRGADARLLQLAMALGGAA